MRVPVCRLDRLSSGRPHCARALGIMDEATTVVLLRPAPTYPYLVSCVSSSAGDRRLAPELNATCAKYAMNQGTSARASAFFRFVSGDGEVEGILFNAIAPDIRTRSVAQTAALIIGRLRLMSPILDKDVLSAPDWPEQPPPLRWPMADHSEARIAFERPVNSHGPWRVLLVRGPSDAGKSHITRQMLGNALRVPDLACGGSISRAPPIWTANWRAFAQYLDVTLPSRRRAAQMRALATSSMCSATGRPPFGLSWPKITNRDRIPTTLSGLRIAAGSGSHGTASYGR